MQQILKKASFTSGIVLLFSPIIFTVALNMFPNIKSILDAFSPDKLPVFLIAVIIILLEIIFFIKLFKAYCFHSPDTYFLIYFLGILTFLGVCGSIFSSIFVGHFNFVFLFLCFLLLFSLISFRYQRNQLFPLDDFYLAMRKKIVFLLSINVGIAIIGLVWFYVSSLFLSPIFYYIISSLIALPFFHFGKKGYKQNQLRALFFYVQPN